MEFMAIVHLYSGARTGTYQRGLLPKFTSPMDAMGKVFFFTDCTMVNLFMMPWLRDTWI